MHDPMHVVFEVRRPWPKRSSRVPPPGPNPRRNARGLGPVRIRPAEFVCGHCDHGKVEDPPPSYHEREGYQAGDPCPSCAGRGFNFVPRRRRLYLSWAFWQYGGREWYFPSLITLWHVDPEADGTDSSCRNRYRPALRAAQADKDGLREWFWWKVSCHHDKWHVHHWKVQVSPAQKLRRWLFTRCAGCGERLPYGYTPIASHWDAPPHRWWESEVGVYHRACYDRDCAVPPRVGPTAGGL